MDVIDLGVSLGRLHEKTDHQTELLKKIEKGQEALTVRVGHLETVNKEQKIVWRYAKGFITLAIGLITGKLWH